ncbi:MAG TPA: HD domain-containing protein [Bacillota bacterium]|nr:HD domain-containing protein [Bacillota bacterium]
MTVHSILDINEPSGKFSGYALVKSVQHATASNGSPYFTIFLSEKEKSVNCKLWENQFQNNTIPELQNIFKVGQIVFVEASISEYRGDTQMTLLNYRSTTEDEIDLTDFIASAPESLDSMQEEFESYIEAIENNMIRTICHDLYMDNQSLFLTHPAAKTFHHSFRSGLLYHTLSMLRLAKHICSQYAHLNRDLVYAAIALHDLGKVVELTDALAPDYTKVGNLLGHITIVNMFIDRKVQQLKMDDNQWERKDFDLVYELMHITSAHHGKLEYGSPVEPKILEAEVVHLIDMLDSRINMVIDGLNDDNLSLDDPKLIRPLGLYYKTTK